MSNIDFASVLIRIGNNSIWEVSNTYESIIWNESNTQPKPTMVECEAVWKDIINEAPMKKLRKERNKKLLATDKYIIVDWPHKNENIKQQWIVYRQLLRDLPTISTPLLDSNDNLVVNWPEPPATV